MKITALQKAALLKLATIPADSPNAGNLYYAVHEALREAHPEKGVRGSTCALVGNAIFYAKLVERTADLRNPMNPFFHALTAAGRAAIGLTTLLLALFAAGCCPQAHELVMTGEPMPPDAALVLKVAQERCDRPIVGTFEWRAGPDDHTREIGHCTWQDGGGCPMEAWAALPSAAEEGEPWRTVPGVDCAGTDRASALCSAEAHEIGHWCLSTPDETPAEEWGAAVNEEAARRRSR